MKKIILSALIGAASISAGAQDAFFSNYQYSSALTNPSLMSVTDDISLTALYRSQWMSVVRPFSTAQFEASYPLKKSVTNEKWAVVGLSFVNDRMGEGGYLMRNNLALNFAYNFNFGTHNLAAGLQLGYQVGTTDPNALTTGSQWTGAGYDPTAGLGEDVSNPVVNGFGISPSVTWYMNDSTGFNQHYVGITAFNVNQPEQGEIMTGFGLPLRLSVVGGTRVDFGSTISLTPSALFMMQASGNHLVAGTDVLYHLDRSADKRKAVGLGGFFRVGEAAIIRAKYVSGSIDAGLSYDLSISSVKEGIADQNGSIEIFLNYRIGTKRANKTYYFNLYTFDESTQEKLPATVTYKSLTTGERGTLMEGDSKLSTELNVKEEYEITVEREGYEPQTFTVYQTTQDDLQKEILLAPELRTFDLEMAIMDKETGEPVPSKVYEIDPVTGEKTLIGEGSELADKLESGVQHKILVEAEGYDVSVVDIYFDKYGTMNRPVYLNKTPPEIDLAMLKLKVLDEDTRKPLAVTVMISDVSDPEERNTSLMVMNEQVPETYGLELNKDFELLITKEGYFNGSVKLRVDEKKDYERVVLLRSLGVGKSIVLDDLLFKVNSAEIDERSITLLNQLVDFMKQNPGIRIEIGGHTDSDGSDAYNQQLSEKRAQSAVDYMVKRGIPSGRLEAKGYGEVDPVAPNDSDANKAKNRRVEMKVIE